MPLFMGALDELTNVRNYEQFGTLTPDEMVELFQTVMDTYSTEEGDCVNEIGGVMHFFGQGPGYDWLLCDGAPHDRVDYPELYARLDAVASSLIVDADTFRVPNLIGNFLLGTDETPGDTGGAVTHTLTTGEMPAHTHSVNNPGVVNVQPGVGATPNVGPGLPTVTGSTGGGGAHNNMPPYITAVPFIRAR